MRTVSIDSPKRKENESFDSYRERRADENRRIKAHLRGTLIWDSGKQGTAIKKRK